MGPTLVGWPPITHRYSDERCRGDLGGEAVEVSDAWQVARLTAADLGVAYADGSLSPTEALDAALTVVDDAEPELNALWHRADDAARLAAAESSERWRNGLPRGP